MSKILIPLNIPKSIHRTGTAIWFGPQHLHWPLHSLGYRKDFALASQPIDDSSHFGFSKQILYRCPIMPSLPYWYTSIWLLFRKWNLNHLLLLSLWLGVTSSADTKLFHFCHWEWGTSCLFVFGAPWKSSDVRPDPYQLSKKRHWYSVTCVNDIDSQLITFWWILPFTFRDRSIFSLLKKPTLGNDNVENYHSVSSLSFLSKVLEKVVARWLISHFKWWKSSNPFSACTKHFT